MNHIDYRHTEEAYLTMVAQSEMKPNTDPIKYPEDMFYVESVEVRESANGKEYKKAVLKSNNDYWYTVTVFPDYAEYSKVEKGSYVDGWVRQNIKGETLVGYSKPERMLEPGEKFYSPNRSK